MNERLFDVDAIDRQALQSEFHGCSLSVMGSAAGFTIAGLFAGIGGIELGLRPHGGHTELLCEYWEPARRVLSTRFPDVPLVGDVREVESLPKVDLVTAGFPCTDLSQAGRMRGITGDQSGLIAEVFRLLRKTREPCVMLENVRNMLVLDEGRAMRTLVDALEELGYRWAYRLVDSRFTGVPQRRQRVIFLAALADDPRAVLFADDAGEPGDDYFADDVFGFYWTEGLRGLGWARDAVPTLKGGSTIGIPSPPALWNPGAQLGMRVITPRVEEVERLQGFPPDWTAGADEVSSRKGSRWKLVGNAVTVDVASWVGRRLRTPGEPILAGAPLRSGDRWPTAAFGAAGKCWAVDLTLWPTREPYQHLAGVVALDDGTPLSARGAGGFLARARRGGLRFADGFLEDVSEHVACMGAERSVA